MKKMKFAILALGVLLIASCVKPSEKAAGTYTGTAVVGANSYSGTVSVTSSGDNTVNILATANSVTYTANNATASLANDIVTLTYSSNTTTSMEVKTLSGSVTGNNISLVLDIILLSPSTFGATFTGTK